MNVSQNLERSAERCPDHPAIAFEGSEVTYGALDRTANRAAAEFRARGIGRGDRVALSLPNTPGFVVAYYALLKIGAIVVPIDPRRPADEVRFILDDSGAAHLSTADTLATIAEAAAADRPAPLPSGVDLPHDAPATLLYPAGVDGTPKGVLLSHGNVLANVEAAAYRCGIRDGDRLLLLLPLSHPFGHNAMLNCGIRAGATILLHRRFALDAVVAAVRDERATKLVADAAVYRRLLTADLDRSDLGQIPYAFATAPVPAMIERLWLDRTGRPLHQGYGLAETAPFATYNHDPLRRPGSVGRPLPGVAVRVVDDLGRDLPPGVTGEVVVRGPNVMLGYWNRPQTTAAAMRGEWFCTGDRGRLDADGFLYLGDAGAGSRPADGLARIGWTNRGIEPATAAVSPLPRATLRAAASPGLRSAL